MRYNTFILLFVIIAAGCNLKTEEAKRAEGKLQGLHKFYYPDGELYLEIHYKDSLPHGTTKIYFKNGQVQEQSEYIKGVRSGPSKTFYESGQVSTETFYDSGRLHGVKKKFRRDGGLAYEALYHYDKPCDGLKEYFVSGNPVNNYPTVVVKMHDELLKRNLYVVEFSLSDKSRSVEFFNGTLTDGKYIGVEATPINTENGVGRITYMLPPGAFLMERVNVVARIKTDLGNYVIRELTVNVAAENRW